jgi:hypothetical protein
MSRLRLKISMSLEQVVRPHGLELVRTVATPKVTHLKYARP